MGHNHISWWWPKLPAIPANHNPLTADLLELPANLPDANKSLYVARTYLLLACWQPEWTPSKE
jgi:hypothetical protein